MDNQFDNGFYGDQPQRPFTEKNEPEVPVQPVTGFQPEKPLMQKEQPAWQQPAQPVYPQQPQQPVYPPQKPQPNYSPDSYDPVQHTAVYQNGAFVQQPQQPQQPPQGYGYQPPQPPQPPQQPSPDFNPYQRQPREIPTGYQPPQPPKQKSNKGLIAVIIVLSVLLVGSLAGIFGFLLLNGQNQQQSRKQENSNGFSIPEFTLPNGEGLIPVPSTTAPVEEHKESDYSDKVQKDYAGLTLNKKPSDAETNKSYNSEYAFNSVSESVVGVMCYADKEKSTTKSQGSGIIISADGYVVTNAHVVGNSKTAYAIKVVTSDGKEYNAGVVGVDSRTDIAVLKMDDAKDLKAATFGDSGETIVGEDIIIVGNPGGINYQNSMTKGIVSALDRDASNKSIVKYIQTDAAINPGNSGGPAVNMYGQVIGIASSKIASVTYEGMAFCIPSQTAKTIVDDLMKNGFVQGRVKIGISGVAVQEDDFSQYGLPKGIEVQSVDKDGPCGSTGLTAGDVVTELDGKKTTTFAEIYAVLEQHKDGDKVKIKYYQASTGKEVEEEITLAADK